MLQLLTRLGDASLVARFIAGALVSRYDSSENQALTAAVKLLTPSSAAEVLVALARESVRYFPKASCELLAALRVGLDTEQAWKHALAAFASEIIDQLPNLRSGGKGEYDRTWWRARNRQRVDAGFVADLFLELAALRTPDRRATASAAIIAQPAVFDPATVLLPALELLNRKRSGAWQQDPEYARVWSHAVESLQDLRYHVQNQYGRDMEYETGWHGSPQTLVSTKTRASYQARCKQHEKDFAALIRLARVAEGIPNSGLLLERITAAKARPVQTIERERKETAKAVQARRSSLATGRRARSRDGCPRRRTR
jgi:hypothetical protein